MRKLFGITLLAFMAACSQNSSTPATAEAVPPATPDIRILDEVSIPVGTENLVVVCDTKRGKLIYIYSGQRHNNVAMAVAPDTSKC